MNPTAVVKSRAGVGKVITRVDNAERIRAFLGMVQRGRGVLSKVSRKASRPSV